MFYWFLKFIAIGPVLRLVFRPTAEGLENVPEEGPAILASNHLSYADWLFMPLAIPRRVTFVAKVEYFTSPGLKGWLQKTFFSGAGPCRCTVAARLPVARRRARYRPTVLTDTPNTAAACSWLIPPSTAATTRSRRSIEYART